MLISFLIAAALALILFAMVVCGANADRIDLGGSADAMNDSDNEFAEAPNPHRTRLDAARGLICEPKCGCGGRLHGGGDTI